MRISTLIFLLVVVSHLALGASNVNEAAKPTKVVGELSYKITDVSDRTGKFVKIKLHYINETQDPLDVNLAGTMGEVVEKSKVRLLPASSEVDSYIWGRDGSRIIVPARIGFMYSYHLRYHPGVDGGTLAVASISGRRDTYQLSDLNDCTITLSIVIGTDEMGNVLLLQSKAIDLAACFYSYVSPEGVAD